MAFELGSTMLKKAVKNILFFGGESTKRVDSVSSFSQKMTWAIGGPSIVFEDPTTLSTFSIGSAKDTKYMASDDFDYVINCAPSEVTVHHARVRCVDLKDDNNASLQEHSQEISTILSEVRDVVQHEKSKILCNCWMGASRSVAVSIFLLAMIYGPSKHDAEKDFNHFYEEIKKNRPSINISCKLKDEVCSMLDRKRSRAQAPRYGQEEEEDQEEREEEGEEEEGKDNAKKTSSADQLPTVQTSTSYKESVTAALNTEQAAPSTE